MGKKHIHKRRTTEEVKEILGRYEQRQVDLQGVLAQLGIKTTRFYELLKQYRNDKEKFTVDYERHSPKRILPGAEKIIKKELLKDKSLVENPKIPVRSYNYSAIHDTLRDDHGVIVSVPTIIARARKHGCYIEKKPKKIHDREVMTNYAGELIQHDASEHKWSPYVDDYWHGITSIDDYSRMLLFADLFKRECSWHHISALQSTILQYGCPHKYYVDQHSIFRFVERRDSLYQRHVLKTDDATPQWKRVLEDCDISVSYALSPQAKGKVERPYRWLQERTVRRCARDHVTKFSEVRGIFREEAARYNTRQIHSTTKEIPIIRFEKAVKEGRTIFRPFHIPEPFKSTKDIFCLRDTKTVDAYRKISFHGLELKVPKVPPRHKVELRMFPDIRKKTVEIRFWFAGELVDKQVMKGQDIPILRF